nr:ABC transporter permease [Psychrobacter sp. PraFG1]UNK05978.1 ABC transporter permease [Psychrobacter sp. PraFG1]
MLLWLPLATILSIWWIFSKPYIVDLPIGVIDDSRSAYSRTLTRYLDASPDIKVEQLYTDMAQVNEDILTKKIYGVVIIPSDFADQINKAAPSPIILKVNAQYGTHSGIIQKGVQAVVGTLSAGWRLSALSSKAVI